MIESQQMKHNKHIMSIFYGVYGIDNRMEWDNGFPTNDFSVLNQAERCIWRQSYLPGVTMCPFY